MAVQVASSDERVRAAKRKRDQAKAYESYKLLHKELDAFDSIDNTEEANEFIAAHLEKTARLYPKIHKRYDLAPIDADHFKKLAALGAEATSKFRVGTALFDLVAFGKKIKKALERNNPTDGYKARCTLASSIHDCIPIPPAFEFMYGIVSSEGVEFKPRAIRNIVKREKVEPKVFTKATEKNSTTETEQDKTPKEVEHIYKRLRRRAKHDKVEQISILENILDSESFGQSVENLFHFSFLVKDGKVAINESNDGMPVCKLIKPSSTQNDTKDKNQSILSFSMSDYKKWLVGFSGNGNENYNNS